MDKGYSVNIYFEDFCGGRSFGLRKDDTDLTVQEFRDFCWDAGRAYGFSENQMDNIFNWDFGDDTN